MVLVLVKTVRDQLDEPTAEVVESIHEVTGAPSGGSIGTILGLNDVWTQAQIAKVQEQDALKPESNPKAEEGAVACGGAHWLAHGAGPEDAGDVVWLPHGPARGAARTWGLLKSKFWVGLPISREGLGGE